GESAALYVRRLAAEKSAAVFAVLKHAASSPFDKLRTSVEGISAASGQNVAQGFSPADTMILAADTTVVVDGEILGKPRDDDEAAEMLRRLSGRRHDVLTGFSIRCDALEVGRVETTGVHFAVLSPDEVTWYVASGAGRDEG